MGLLNLSELSGLGQDTYAAAAPPPLSPPRGPGGYARQYVMPGQAPPGTRPKTITPGIPYRRPARATSTPVRRTTTRARNRNAAAQAEAKRRHQEALRRRSIAMAKREAAKAAYHQRASAYRALMRRRDALERKQAAKDAMAAAGVYGPSAQRAMLRLMAEREHVLRNVPKWAWKDKLPGYVYHQTEDYKHQRERRESAMKVGEKPSMRWMASQYGETLWRPDAELRVVRLNRSPRAERELRTPNPYNPQIPTAIQPHILSFFSR